MHCAFHPNNAAAAQCAGCNRSLCPSCDHRIKGHPHCEDCIVRGVELLRRAGGHSSWPAESLPQPVFAPRSGKSARSGIRAALCGLVPGLGAVYNGQNLKAFAHFLGVTGLFQVASLTDLEFFGFGGAVFYLYTIIDAFRTAKAISSGVDPREEEARLRWSLSRYRAVWGTALVMLAVLVALSSLITLPIPISRAHVWALALFAAGVYLIVSYVRSSKDDLDAGATVPPTPRSVVSTALPPIPEEFGAGQPTGSRREVR